MNLKKSFTVLMFFVVFNFFYLFSSEEAQSPQGVVARIASAVASTALEYLMLTPDDLCDFYQKNCVCPENMNSEVFNTLVRSAFKACALNKVYVVVLKAHQQDQTAKAIISEFGQSVQAKVLELCQEPVVSKSMKLSKLPTFPTQWPTTIQTYIDLIRPKSMGSGKFLVSELVVAANMVYQRQSPHFKKTLSNGAFTDFLCDVYNEFGVLFWKLDCEIADNILQHKQHLASYLAVIQFCIESGDLDYYSKVKTQEQLSNSQVKLRKKIATLYFQEKWKYLIDDADKQHVLIAKEAQIEFENNLTKHGVLVPQNLKKLTGELKGSEKSLQSLQKKEFENIVTLVIADRIKTNLQPEVVSTRKKIEQEIVDAHKNLFWLQLDSLWKVLGKTIVREQNEVRKALKEIQETSQQQVLQQQCDREQTHMKRVVLDKALIAYTSGLNNILDSEKKERANTFLQQIDNQHRSHYFTILKNFIACQKIQSAPSTLGSQGTGVMFQRNSEKLKLVPEGERVTSPSNQQISENLEILEKVQGLVPRVPVVVPEQVQTTQLVPLVESGLPQRSTSVRRHCHNPYAGSVINSSSLNDVPPVQLTQSRWYRDENGFLYRWNLHTAGWDYVLEHPALLPVRAHR